MPCYRLVPVLKRRVMLQGLIQAISACSVLGQKNGGNDAEALKRIEAKYQSNAEDLKREVDELKKRVGRMHPTPPGNSNDDNNS